MSSDDPLENISKGMTEGVLNWGENFIKSLATKFKNKKLGFIQDSKTIEIVKQQYNSGELAVYKEYIKDKDTLFILKMGLTLRRLEKEKDDIRKRNLRTKILQNYKVKGLHIAQFVENGLLNRYVGILIDDIVSLDKFKKDIREILDNIEKHVLFVKMDDSVRGVIQKTTSIIAAHSPTIFILSGISSAADTLKNCEEKLVELLNEYELEKISGGQKEILFFKCIIK